MEKSAALVLDKDYSNGLLWAGLESSWITPSKIGKLILKKYGRGPFNRMLNVKRAAQFKQRSLELATIYDEVSLIGPRDPRLFNWRKLKAEGVVHAVGTFDDVPKDVIIPTDYLASRLWISRNSITRAINSTLHLANIKFTMKVFEVWRLCEVFLLLKEHLGADSGHDLWRILTVVAPKNTPLGYKFIRDKDYSSIFLRSIGVESFKVFKSGSPEGAYLLVGAFEPQQTGNPLVTDILEWVNEGNTLIIVNNIERWAEHLAQKEVIDYRGAKVLGKSWYGGNYFSKEHTLFDGLPQACVFNWEYQCFATYNKNRLGLRLFNGETVLACVSDHKKEVYSALSIIPHGRGKIVMCALDMFSCIKDVKPEKKAEGEGENAAMASLNASQRNKANVVGWQLLLNMLRYAGAEESR